MNQSPCPETALQFTLLARIDWILLMMCTFPMQIVTPFMLLLSPYPSLVVPALFYSLLQTGAIFILMTVLALLFDAVRGWFAVDGTIVTFATRDSLRTVLSEYLTSSDRELLDNLQVVSGDISLGAQVRGVVSPQIIISGGLLVGLLRKDSVAIGIFLHEIAHIRHFDRLLPAFITLSMMEFIHRQHQALSRSALSEFEDSDLAMIVFMAAYQLIVFGAVISLVSKYREFYADARALKGLKERAAYQKLLSNAAEGPQNIGFHYFHPSPALRTREAINGYQILIRSNFWKVFWVLNTIISWIQWKYAHDLNIADYAFGVMVMSMICLAFESIRKPLLFASEEFVSGWADVFYRLRPNRTALRYAFMLCGFVAAAAIGHKYGGANRDMWISVGGAIVYGISRTMK